MSYLRANWILRGKSKLHANRLYLLAVFAPPQRRVVTGSRVVVCL